MRYTVSIRVNSVVHLTLTAQSVETPVFLGWEIVASKKSAGDEGYVFLRALEEENLFLLFIFGQRTHGTTYSTPHGGATRADSGREGDWPSVYIFSLVTRYKSRICQENERRRSGIRLFRFTT